MVEAFRLGRSGKEPAITCAGATITYTELQSLIDGVLLPADGALDLAGRSVAETLAAVFAAAASGRTVLVRGPDSDVPHLPALPAGILLVAMTSGTSGRARGVIRTAESWAASFRPLADLAGLTGGDTVLMTGPLHSTLHLFGAVHTLWLGAHLTDVPASASAAHAVPAALGDLLGEPSVRLRTAVVAGAAVPAAVEAAAANRGVRLVEYYGAAELSFVAARVAPSRLRPFPGVEVRITDGVLSARSDYLAVARVDDLDGTARLTPIVDADGFASVGDLADWADDGSLVIRGRGDAAVTTGGHTVIVEDVESVIGTISGVTAVAVVGMPHLRLGQILAAAVEMAPGTALADIKHVARQQLSGHSFPRVWQAVATLPRTAGGKIARAAVTADLSAGHAFAAASTDEYVV